MQKTLDGGYVFRDGLVKIGKRGDSEVPLCLLKKTDNNYSPRMEYDIWKPGRFKGFLLRLTVKQICFGNNDGGYIIAGTTNFYGLGLILMHG